MNNSALNSDSRVHALQQMSEHELDVLVVGGGVVGAGAALDAASRGLSVGIVEQRDWASGTSSRSSKLIHGGLRYLEMLDFRLVFEALRERGLLIRTIAPHLIRPVSFLYPLTHRVWERAYVGAGILLYDLLALLGGNNRGMAWHKHLSRTGAHLELPGLSSDAVVGAIRYSDAQVDDARHTMTVVRTAVSHGAHAANRAGVKALIRDGERVLGAIVVDHETGREYTVRAKRTILAGGVWTDDLENLGETRGDMTVRASKGTHIVVERERIPGTSGIILRTEKSVLFVIPFGSRWIIGTTDTDWKLGKAHPSVSAEDITYILKHVNTVLDEPLTTDDIVGVYAGLRPLVSGRGNQTAKLSREHHIDRPLENLTVIAGGKYTTYRVMAKDAVDSATQGLPGVPKSPTATIPLLGAEGYADAWESRAQLAAAHNLPTDLVERMLHRYGSHITEVLDLLAANPDLARPLPSNDDHIQAEVVYAVTHEGARHLDDILTRRTRLSTESWDRGVESAAVVAELVAPLLGWDDEETAREIAVYRARVDAERRAQLEPDDSSSEAVRLSAPEIV